MSSPTQEVVPVEQQPNLPVVPTDDEMTGLEDVEATDLVMPRITLDHDDGVFVDSLSNERYEKLTVVMLGLIKQRVLWPPDISEGDKKPPLCRSYNFQQGRPSAEDGNKFPWSATTFDKDAANKDEKTGDILLPCQACPLKDWGSHPKKDSPWCSEQHVFPVLIDGISPALMTFQRSAIKASRAYLSAFFQRKMPLYTVWTDLTLEMRKRGNVDYAVPKFMKGGATDQDNWGQYAVTYRQVREFVQTPRTREEEEAATAPQSPPTPPAQAASAAQYQDEDDLPFSLMHSLL